MGKKSVDFVKKKYIYKCIMSLIAPIVGLSGIDKTILQRI